MADREVKYIFRKKDTSGSTLPSDGMVAEPFVNTFEGRMFFYGTPGGSYSAVTGQPNVFEVGANVDYIYAKSGITTPYINAGIMLSGGTNLYDIFIPSGSSTGGGGYPIQPGLNTYTGGTYSSQTINVSAATLDNLSVSGATSLGSVSATTLISGSTNLYDIFDVKGSEDITRVQPGANTYTAGTDNNPSVNVSAATLDNLAVSGVSTLSIITATTISATTIVCASLPSPYFTWDM